MIKDILIGNFWNSNGVRLLLFQRKFISRSKQEMLERIHADVFIDDNCYYVRDVLVIMHSKLV